MILDARIAHWTRALAFMLCMGLLVATSAHARANQLPSWNDGPARKAIVEFVKSTTDKSSPNYVAPDERVATFDNDGTLWSEQPMYVQGLFALDRVKVLGPQHPEWKTQEPFASVLKGDLKAALAGGDKALLEIVMATHAGMTTEEFQKIVKDWIATARNPVTRRPVLEMVYQPMVELLAYLRANGYKTFIVSGGGIEFMRPWAERVYGVPPEQVVGSSIKTRFEMQDGKAVLVRLAELNFIDDKDGKPVGINQHIGRRPVAAFGNSDGDRQMLEYATTGSGLRFGMLVLHDDKAREFAYGPANGLPDNHVGTFSQSLYDEARQRGWIVISMKSDWKRIFPSAP
jgi:phosphoserine phosphatase